MITKARPRFTLGLKHLGLKHLGLKHLGLKHSKKNNMSLDFGLRTEVISHHSKGPVECLPA